MQYYQVFIAAEQRSQGMRLLDVLMAKQLIEEAEKASLEEVCMISFLPMEGNAALIKLLESTFAGREKETEAPKPVDAVAALTFVKSSDIPSRTNSSFS